jgi:hypothetical protein
MSNTSPTDIGNAPAPILSCCGVIAHSLGCSWTVLFGVLGRAIAGPLVGGNVRLEARGAALIAILLPPVHMPIRIVRLHFWKIWHASRCGGRQRQIAVEISERAQLRIVLVWTASVRHGCARMRSVKISDRGGSPHQHYWRLRFWPKKEAYQPLHSVRGGKLLSVRFARILLKKSEGMFCAQFPVEPSLADAVMIELTR